MREAFESWVTSNNPEYREMVRKHDNGHYVHSTTQIKWVAWQAAVDYMERTA